MNYQEAEATLGNRDKKKVGNNTWLERRGPDAIALRLHATDVLTFRPGETEYNTGGWNTVTTKERMNSFGPPVRVSSMRGTWYVGSEPYFDGIRVADNGIVLNPLPKDEADEREKERKARRKQISAYVQQVKKQFAKGLRAPNSGDCFYCYMQTDSSTSLGDAFEDKEHLLSHIRESYVVPTLLFRAVVEAGYPMPTIILGLSQNGENIGGDFGYADLVGRSVRKYLTKRLIQTEGARTNG